MYRFFTLTSITCLCCLSLMAQQNLDTLSTPQQAWQESGPYFSDFSGSVKNSSSIELQWHLENMMDADFFVVERSSDGTHYETLSAQQVSDTSSNFGHTDSSPLNGTDYYRIKFISKSGRYIYSKVLQLSFSKEVDFKFYPNPADKLLIIRTGHNIEVQILDESGKVMINKQLQPGLQVINVAALERGNYWLKIADKDSNRVSSEPLVKN